MLTNCADSTRRPDEPRIAEIASILATAVLRLRCRESVPNSETSEIPTIPASRLQESRFDPFALVCDKVEHIVDQLRRGEHLSVVDDTLARIWILVAHNLLCRSTFPPKTDDTYLLMIGFATFLRSSSRSDRLNNR